MPQDAANNDNDPMLVMFKVSELREMIRTVIREELGGLSPAHEWLTTEQLAKRLEVNSRSIATMVSRDKLPTYRLGPRLHRFLWSEVQAWVMGRGKNLDQIPARKPRVRLRAVRGE